MSDYEDLALQLRHTISIFLLTIGISFNGLAVRYYVSTSGPNTTGLDWANAFNDVGIALTTAASGDTIWVAAGSYSPDPSDRNISFTIVGGITLLGGFDGTETTHDQRNWSENKTILEGDINGPGNKFDNTKIIVTAPNIGAGRLIDGFIIQNAYNDGGTSTSGGGLLLLGQNVEVRNCVFYANENVVGVEGGGAIAQDGGGGTSGIIHNCIFLSNTSTSQGGAIWHRRNTLDIYNCTFVNNSVPGFGDGGAIFQHSGGATNLNLTNCAFWHNYEGGSGKNLELRNTSFIENSFILSTDNIGAIGANILMDQDPEFVDPYGLDLTEGTMDDDLHLSCNSAGVNFGTNVPPVLTFDYNNFTTTGQREIGAFETQELGPGTIVHVDVGIAGGLNNGLTWADSYNDLTYALDHACGTGLDFWVAAGQYYPHTSSDRSRSIQLRDDLRLFGGFQNGDAFGARDLALNPTILSGDLGQDAIFTNNSYHVVRADQTVAGARLDGFIIEAGYADNISPNDQGAGLYLRDATLDVVNVLFRNNQSVGNAGAVYMEAIVGGPYTDRFENTLFHDNIAGNDGGALMAYTNGGSMRVDIINSTFTENNATNNGGALYWRNNAGNLDVSVENSIIYNNFAASNPSWYETAAPPSPNSITNSLIQDVACPGTAACASVLFNTNPNFINPPTKDYQLASNSPAIDYGNNGFVNETTDIIGLNRIQGSSVDLGPFESSCNSSTIFVHQSAAGANDGSSWANAYTDLQVALDKVCDPNTQIWVAEGSYTRVSPGGDQFNVSVPCKIYGGFAGTETLLSERDFSTYSSVLNSSKNSQPIINFNDIGGASILDGFTLNSGTSLYGVYNSNGAININNCRFNCNTPIYALWDVGLNDDSVSIYNCLIRPLSNENQAIYLDSRDGSANQFKMVNTTITEYAAGAGDLFYMDGGGDLDFYLRNNILWNNTMGGQEFNNASLGLTDDVDYLLHEQACPFSCGGIEFLTDPNMDVNYVPQAPSDAIDNGADGINPFTVDLDMQNRLQGAATDFGAFEYTVCDALYVTTTTDDAPGTGGQCGDLRFAMEFANTNPGADTITFDPALDGDSIVVDASNALPSLSGAGAAGTVIDGSMGLGDLTPHIRISGLGTTFSGFDLSADNCVLRQLNIGNFNASGAEAIGMYGNAGLIDHCVIGLNIAGTQEIPNDVGIQINGSDNTVQKCVISGNAREGIDFNGGGSGNFIYGNIIGLDTAGVNAFPNTTGINIFNNTGNQIGDGTAENQNIISGNTGRGIDIASDLNIIDNNYIGLQADGNSPAGNGNDGIIVWNASGNYIQNSWIGNNNGLGINYGTGAGASSITIRDNTIGVGLDGSTNAGNLSTGISSTGNGAIMAGNYINYNGAGVLLNGDGYTFTSNYVGLLIDGVTAAGNGTNYNLLMRGTNGVIGGTLGDENYITSGNSSTPAVESDGSDNINLIGNFIGVNTLGNPVPSQHGIQLGAFVTNDTIMGNVIAFNNNQGIDFIGDGTTLNNFITDNNIYSNGGDGILFSGVEQSGILPPVITGIAGDSTVSGTGMVGATLELFADSTHEGQQLITSLTIPVGGTWSYKLLAADLTGIGYPGGGLDSLTATQSNGNNTSEFSNPIELSIVSCDPLYVTSTADDSTCGTLRYALGYASNVAGNDTITFDFALDGDTIWTDNPLYINNDPNTYVNASGVEIWIRPSSSHTGGELILNEAVGTRITRLRLSGEYPDASRIDIGIETMPTSANFIIDSIQGINFDITALEFRSPNSFIQYSDFWGNGQTAMTLDLPASGTTVRGNRVGTNAAGTIAMGGNSIAGIAVIADNVLIGGTNATDRNIISGNDSVGLFVIGTNVNVQNNYIGVNSAGNAAIPNQIGIEIDDSFGGIGDTNTIGNGAASGRNIISGNSVYGILIGNNANDNAVIGNYIGTNAGGNVAVPNGKDGIRVNSGATFNTIGGVGATDGNIISGNTENGIMIEGLGTQDNLVISNSIGLSSSDTQLGNLQSGVVITGNAGFNNIGNASFGNSISGNGEQGIGLDGSNNTVVNNIIGLNSTGNTIIGNAQNGVWILSGSSNVIEQNVISGNSQHGVRIQSDNNTVRTNFIGSDLGAVNSMPNGFSGISLDNVNGNLIDTNVIAYNAGLGIELLTGGNTNGWLGNNIYSNIGGGVFVDGAANGGILAPTITGIGPDSVVSGTADPFAIVSVYADSAYQGQFLLDTTSADASGDWSYQITTANLIAIGHPSAIDSITALQELAGNSSEFSNPVALEFCDPLLVTTITDANAGAGGTCGDLRFAMEYASTNLGPDTIFFDASIMDQIITIAASLPDIDGDSTMIQGDIDGNGNPDIGIDATLSTAQCLNVIGVGSIISGLKIGNSNGGTSIGVLVAGDNIRVENCWIGTLDGTIAAPNSTGIQLASDGDTLVNNIISGNGSSGVTLNAANNCGLLGNIIGLDSLGNDLGNFTNGIHFNGSSNFNTIGDGTAIGRNIISGNDERGIMIQSSTDNLIIGNYIGTDPTGLLARPNTFDGITVFFGNDNQIGDGSLGGRNVISGNIGNGIGFNSSGSTNVIGNYIGTDLTGLVALPNNTGIRMDANSVDIEIGDGTAGGVNVISGNAASGIYIFGADDNMVDSNLIGIGADAITPVPNAGNGLFIANNAVDDTIQNNVIAFNGINGIRTSVAGTERNNWIQNSFFGNSSDAIFIEVGSQQLIVPPVILSLGTDSIVRGTAGNSEFVQLYADSSTQAQHYIATVQADGTGNWQYQLTAGDMGFINSIGLDTLVAIQDSAQSSSGLSIPFELSFCDPLLVTLSTDNFSGTGGECGDLRFAMEYANSNLGPDTISFDNPTMIGATIQPQIELPHLTTDSTVMLGDIDANCRPDVEINGLLVAGVASGVNIAGGTGIHINGVSLTGWDNVGFSSGIEFSGGTGPNMITSSYIGLDLTGNTVSANRDGVRLITDFAVLGGDNVCDRNVIAGNNNAQVTAVAANLSIKNNYIGTNWDGTTTYSNVIGINADPIDNSVITDNLISGNSIGIYFTGGDQNIVRNNMIGTDFSGSLPLPNINDGINFEATTNSIADSNIIAFNGGTAIYSDGAQNNLWSFNSIYSNSQGINFLNLGADQGTILAPVITSINPDSTVDGTSEPLAWVYLYADSTNQGQLFVDSTQADGAGDWTLQLTSTHLSSIGHPTGGLDSLTAIQTSGGNSSPFSAPVFIDFCDPLLVTLNTDANFGSGGQCGDLRFAMEYANANSGYLQIIFDAALSGQNITPLAPLPILTSDSTIIDGDINLDGYPDIGIDGGTAGGTGFQMNGNFCELLGLKIFNFSGNGVDITADDILIADCYIGLLDGVTFAGNGLGINIQSGSNNNSIEHCVIANNGGFANVQVNGNNNSFLGNIIGLDSAGTTPQPTPSEGFFIQTAYGTDIGDGTVSGRNVISGGTNGIYLDQADTTTILGNFIGLDITGVTTLANSSNGISLVNMTECYIGDGTLGGRNVISGNGQSGIFVSTGCTEVSILGNYIGVDTTGTIDLGNSNGGVVLSNASYVYVGDGTAGAGNLVSGNSGAGIQIGNGSNNNFVLGNYVGTDVTGTLAIANSDGITIFNSDTNFVGDGTAGGVNLISGNSIMGINLSNANLNVIDSVLIGVTIDGISQFPTSHANDGITFLQDCQNNLVTHSVIAYNSLEGIEFQSAGPGPSLNTVSENSIFSNGTIGIDLQGGTQGNILPPVILAIDGSDSTVTGSCENNAYIELFADSAHEGQVFLAGFNAVGTSWSYQLTNADLLLIGHPTNGLDSLTATQTNALGNTSEFSLPLYIDFCDPLLVTLSTDNQFGSGGECGDLRFAMEYANSNLGPDTIQFDNPTLVGATISLGAILPPLTSDSTVINADINSDCIPDVEVAGVGGNTIDIIGDYCELRGLVLNGGSRGVIVRGDSNVIAGNYFGTDLSGTVAVPNTTAGISNIGSGNLYGGTSVCDRNVISGNGGNGIAIGGDNALIINNFIGVDVTGLVGLGNGTNGIHLDNSLGGHRIGSSGMGNVISGNSAGIYIEAENNDTIQGNIIGLNATGTTSIAGSGTGILFDGANSGYIGGLNSTDGNIISGHTVAGIRLEGNGSLIQNNIIGLDISESSAIGNAVGIQVNSVASGLIRENLIGGNGVGIYDNGGDAYTIVGNIIGYNGTATSYVPNTTGIYLDFSLDISIDSNYIVGSTGLGLDVNDAQGSEWLGNYVYANNTSGIGFTGIGTQNNLLPPTVDAVAIDSTVTGTSAPNALIQLFADSTSQGQFLIDTFSADGSGNWSYTLTNLQLSTFHTGGLELDSLTAIQSVGSNSSEFSLPLYIDFCDPLLVTLSTDNQFGSGGECGDLRFAMEYANANPGADSIVFDNPGMLGATIQPQAVLPVITSDSNVINGLIDGDCLPDITLDGALLGNVNMIDINDGDFNVIQGLSIVNTVGPTSGIAIRVHNNADSNRILGNHVGVDATGLISQPFSGYLVRISESSRYNIIGGVNACESNLISGGGSYGLAFISFADSNEVYGNLIGTDITGTSSLGTQNIGVLIDNVSVGNQIGGGAANEGNTISGNTNGIYFIEAGTEGNRIVGNNIGTDITGTMPLPNTGNGIYGETDVANNTIGGFLPGEGNTIAFNGNDGIHLEASGVVYGFNYWANSIYSNGSDGIENEPTTQEGILPPIITGLGLDSIVTGTSEPFALIQLYADSAHEGQYFIDTTRADAAGDWSYQLLSSQMTTFHTGGLGLDSLTALQDSAGNTSQFSNPIFIDFCDPLLVTVNTDNQFGAGGECGDLRFAMEYANANIGFDTIRFLLPDNSTISPMAMLPTMIDSTRIDGDMDADGFPDIKIDCGPNSVNGALIITGQDNSINGIVVANAQSEGITINGGANNTIENNFLGIDFDGIGNVGSQDFGLLMFNGSVGNIVRNNVISWNLSTAINIDDASNSLVTNNIIGLDSSGVIIAGNGGQGINISGSILTSNNRVESNIVSGNFAGIQHDFGDSTYIINNTIGLNVLGNPVPNTSYGIRLDFGVTDDSLVNNTIAYNGGDGIRFGSGTTQNNSFSQNSIYSNGILGIQKYANAHGNIIPPVITGLALDSTVSGTSAPNAVIELFADSANQGQFYIGTTVADGLGDWSYQINNAQATQFNSTLGLDSLTAVQDSIGNSSEFSQPVLWDFCDPLIVDLNTDNLPLSGGECGDLRFAIEYANINVGPDTITFALVDDTIIIDEQLFVTGDPGTFIDGGNSNTTIVPTNNITGFAALLLIQTSDVTINRLNFNGLKPDLTTVFIGIESGLSGDDVTYDSISVTQSLVGINIRANSNLISNSHFFDNTGDVSVEADSTLIIGNLFGTDNTGLIDGSSSIFGVSLSGNANVIGGLSPTDRNIFAGIDSVGIFISGSNNEVYNNYIGLAIDGSALGNDDSGIRIEGDNNLIGDGTAAGRNIISNSGRNGILIDGALAFQNTIDGNYIGTDVSGTVDMGNAEDGIQLINGATNNIIGIAGNGNLISGNDERGIDIFDAASTGNTISGNFIGTDVSGNVALSNVFQGVDITGDGNIIGLPIFNGGNVISGNLGENISISGSGNYIQNNKIGLGADSTTQLLTNTSGSLLMFGDLNIIGGFAPFEANVITSGSTTGGIFTVGTANDNVWHGNSITSNGGLGIDKTAPTQRAILPPVITSLGLDSTISGTSAPNALIQLYADSTHEGAYFIDTTSADPSGNWSYKITDAAIWNGIHGFDSLTAIQDSASPSNSSIFSQPFFWNFCDPLIVTELDDDSTCGDLRFAMAYANINVGPDTITFDTLAMGGTLISPLSPLPYINDDSTVIIGDVNGDCLPDVRIDGTLETGTDNGINIHAGHVVIQGLSLTNWTGSIPTGAIYIDAAIVDSTYILGNYIGLDLDGTTIASNRQGITSHAGLTRIGGANVCERNVVGGQLGNGITITANSIGNVIENNYIGVASDGITPVGNNAGILTSLSASNSIIRDNLVLNNANIGIRLNSGSNHQVIGNTVSNNGSEGIQVSSDSNTVTGNYIGTDVLGTVAQPNGNGGLMVNGSNNTIGGASALLRNVISGNAGVGLTIDIGGNNTVIGNFIGVDITGNIALPNSSQGLYIQGGTGNNIIGQAVVDGGNVISGNGGDALIVFTDSNIVQNNYLGIGYDGITPIISGSVAPTVGLYSNHTLFGGFGLLEANVVINEQQAVFVVGDSNLIDANVITGNGQAINQAGNFGVVPPTVDAMNVVGSDTIVTGTSAPFALVQIYADSANQGARFLDTTYADGAGDWSKIITNWGAWYPSLGLDSLTALQDSAGNTSAFSAPLFIDLCNPLVVTDSSDNFTCGTFRYAIDYANNNPGADTITFVLPGAERTITPNIPLPYIDDDYTYIDGDIDNDNIPDVEISGIYAGANTDGLSIRSSYNTIDGLIINGFQNSIISSFMGHGITIVGDSSKYNTVVRCYIGVDRLGATSVPNDLSGISIYQSNGNVIGDGTSAGRNIISGNGDRGISILDSDSNTVIGNFIGLDASGNVGIGNDTIGVVVVGSSEHNEIGRSGQGNVISGHTGGGPSSSGIQMWTAAANSIQGNVIGLNATQTAAIPNETGIGLGAGINPILVGGSLPGEGNVVAGNSGPGITIWGNDGSIIQGNAIGSSDTYNPFANLIGIFIANNSQTINIGGENAGEGNVIGGNTGNGISFDATINQNVNILGNYIGVNPSFNTLPNGGSGIDLANGSINNLIGNGTAGGVNYIADNIFAGISVDGAAALDNTWHGNSIFDNGTGIVFTNGSQEAIVPPVITGIASDRTVSGTSSPNALIQLYADAGSQGQFFIDTVTADGAGDWSITVLTATETNFNVTLGLDSITAIQDDLGNSSEFSLPYFWDICPDSADLSIAVDTSFCTGETLVVEVNGYAGSSFEWFESNVSQGVSTIDDSTFSITTSGTYHAQVTLSPGCLFESDTIDVTENISPDTTMTISGDTTFCAGDSVMLSVPSGETYQWLDGGVALIGQNSDSYTTLVSGNFSVAIDNGLCQDTSRAVVVTASPAAVAGVLDVPDDTICDGGSSTADLTLSSGTIQWQQSLAGGAFVNFGSGLTTEIISPTLAETDAIYRAIVTTGGCSDTSNTDTLVIESCTMDAEFTADLTSICEGDVVTFTDASIGASGAATYAWNFGVGATPATATGIGPHTVTYATAGAIDVDLTITDGATDSENKIGYITVNSSPVAGLTSNGQDLCNSVAVTLTATPSGMNYTWFRNSTQKIVGATTDSYNAYLSGNYSVIVDNGTCVDTSASVAIAIQAGAGTPTITGTIPMTSSAGPSYQWYVDVSGTRLAIVGATSQVYTPYYDGNYYVGVEYGTNCIMFSNATNINSTGFPIVKAGLTITDSTIVIPNYGTMEPIIHVYPNPAGKEFRINYRSASNHTIEYIIYNQYGSIIMSGNSNKTGVVSDFEVNSNSLASGVYLIKVIDGLNVTTSKVVIEK